MTWLPSVSGRAIDLVDPTPAQVDFREMAHALANLNRYGGHGFIQVSVGLHLLIGLDLCPDPVKPYWLLHDGHEERLGDFMRGVKSTLGVICAELYPTAPDAIAATFAEFERRHDVVIHAAAGLPMPNAAIRKQIADIDMRCIATEHRDFHRPSLREWKHQRDGVPPARNVRRWQTPEKIADQLYARFELHLPALSGRRTASLFEGA